MDLAGRRTFLRSAAGAAALTFTSHMSVFGRTHRLNVSAPLTGAAPNLPDRLPPDWYPRNIAQLQQQMANRNLDAHALPHALHALYPTPHFHLPTHPPPPP